MNAWIAAHQAMLLLVWPLATALASLAYKTLDANTRAHAIFSLLASLGIDLPKLWDAFGRALAGGSKPTPPPVVGVFCIGVCLSMIGCNGKPLPVTPSTPGDVGDAVACVVSDVTAGKPVSDCVAKYGQTIIADVLQLLLDSKSFTEEHPEAIAYAHGQLMEVHR